jgi:hypothetical protein
MKTYQWSQIGEAIAALALLLHGQLNAQTWTTVDNFQYAKGKNALCIGLASDGFGNIYGAGQASDSSGVWHAMVMRSPDQGITWTTSLDRPNALGNIYVGGRAFDAAGTEHWIVRKATP